LYLYINKKPMLNDVDKLWTIVQEFNDFANNLKKEEKERIWKFINDWEKFWGYSRITIDELKEFIFNWK